MVGHDSLERHHMLFQEACYLGSLVSSVPAAKLSPLLNIGSSTSAFRQSEQPWIEERVFRPLHVRGVRVLHCDIKAAPGVDLVGDVCNPEYLEELRGIGFKSVICSNLLEHITDPRRVCKAIEDLVARGGYIFVTVPRRYPYHPDPIDTRYRPSPMELVDLFQCCAVGSTEIVDCGTHLGRLKRNRVSMGRFALRLCAPFHRPREWWNQVRLSPWLLRRLQVTCVALQRL